jgi:hypothetical protein
MTWQNREMSSEAPLTSFRKLATSSRLTVSAVETAPSIEADHLLAAHGFTDGSILVPLI